MATYMFEWLSEEIEANLLSYSDAHTLARIELACITWRSRAAREWRRVFESAHGARCLRRGHRRALGAAQRGEEVLKWTRVAPPTFMGSPWVPRFKGGVLCAWRDREGEEWGVALYGRFALRVAVIDGAIFGGGDGDEAALCVRFVPTPGGFEPRSGPDLRRLPVGDGAALVLHGGELAEGMSVAETPARPRGALLL